MYLEELPWTNISFTNGTVVTDQYVQFIDKCHQMGYRKLPQTVVNITNGLFGTNKYKKTVVTRHSSNSCQIH